MHPVPQVHSYCCLFAGTGSTWCTYALRQQVCVVAAELAPPSVRDPEPVLCIALLVCHQPAGQPTSADAECKGHLTPEEES